MSLFAELRAILQPYAGGLAVTADTEADFSLSTKHVMKNGKSLLFAAVKQSKSYVSFHLMPVYVQPGLVARITPDLKRRMHGKSCFNFTRAEPEPFAELARLTAAGFSSYQEQGYV